MLYETRGYRISVKIDITCLKEHAQNSSSSLLPPLLIQAILLCLTIPQEKFRFGSNSPLLSTHGLTFQRDQIILKSLPIFLGQMHWVAFAIENRVVIFFPINAQFVI